LKPTRKQRERLQHRRSILDSAEYLFAHKGFFKTSMAEIAGRAEFSVGSLYQYFKNKDAIYVGLVEEKLEEYFDMVHREVAMAHDIPHKIDALISVKLRFFEEHRDFFNIYVSEWGGSEWTARRALGSRVWGQYESYLSLMTRIMREGMRRGVFVPLNPRQLAYLFNGMMNSVILQWILRSRKESLTKQAPLIRKVFFSGVLRDSYGRGRSGRAVTGSPNARKRSGVK
jgi:TetR/AcrR family transcriptional regulator